MDVGVIVDFLGFCDVFFYDFVDYVDDEFGVFREDCFGCWYLGFFVYDGGGGVDFGGVDYLG